MVDGVRLYGPAGKTKGEARANFVEMLEAKNQPEAIPDDRFGSYFHAQLPRLESQLSPSTHALYKTVCENYVRNDPIGGIQLSKLGTEEVEAWMVQFRAKAPRSQARYLQCLKAILEHAVRTRKIPHNPATPVRPPKIEEHHKDLLDRASLEILLKRTMTARLRTAILLCAHGLRRAEACGLKYEDFDGEGVTIRRQALEVNGELVLREATKTGGTRWVPMEPRLKEILAKGEGWVLGTENGTPLRPRNLAREWTTFAKDTQFEGMTLHDLRSTFGMLMLEKGVDVRTAAEIMGHSPAMLSRIYARSRKELKQEALARVFG